MKSLLTTLIPININNLSDVLYKMQHGKERRKAIIRYLEREDTTDGFAVNRKYMLQTKEDKDLRKLLKNGKLRRCRESRGGSCNLTVLKLNKGE